MNLVKSVFKVFDGKQKRKLFGMAFLILINSGVSLLGVSVLLPFIQAVTAPEELLANRYVAAFYEWMGMENPNELITAIAIGIVIVYLAKNAFIIFMNNMQYRFSYYGKREMQDRLMKYYISKDYTFFLNHNSAELMRDINNDPEMFYAVAKNMLSAALLGKAMQQRMIRREYLAVVCGTLTGSGTVHAPIARVKPGDVRRQVDFLCGDDAITHYKSLLCHAPYSLLSLHLETGRTHQIRVHMSALGYPLAGDQLYYPAFSDTKIKRQALHSHRLSFSHPVTGEMLTFTSPLPCDMAALIDPEPSAHRGSSLPAVLRG